MINNTLSIKFWIVALLAMLCLGCSDERFQAQQAADFELPGLMNDQQYSLSQFRGKVVYLTLWASWCGPCRREMPFLVELHRRYADQGFEVLAVNEDIEPKAGIEFITPFEVPFIVASDTEGVVLEKYNVEGMPTHFIIDREGYVRYSHMGFKDEQRQKITRQVIGLLEN